MGGEVGFSVEGYFVEVCSLGELDAVEGGISSEGGFCITLGGEVGFSVEGYFVEVCSLGELDTIKSYIPNKG